MARYKDDDYSQGKFKIDLSLSDSRYQNDKIGAPAYDPAVLLKIIKIRNCVTNRESVDERK